MLRRHHHRRSASGSRSEGIDAGCSVRTRSERWLMEDVMEGRMAGRGTDRQQVSHWRSGAVWLTLALPALVGCSNNVMSLEPGDCFNETSQTSAGEDIANVPLVDCTTPHRYEVYAVVRVQGDTYDESNLIDFSNEACYAAFSRYVGRDYESSELGITYLYPTPGSWSQGDREVVCSLEDYFGGRLIGSMRGSGR